MGVTTAPCQPPLSADILTGGVLVLPDRGSKPFAVTTDDQAHTVLLVDDHGDVRDGIAILLRDAGYAVVTASNGREALAALYAGLRPCLIIMDLMMPVMNGFEFRDEQLRDDRIASIPFVAYSAVVNLEKNAEHLKADGYFEKPIDTTAIVEVVRQLCPRTAHRSGSATKAPE